MVLAERVERVLRAHRLPGLDEVLPEAFLHPHYGGYSLANLPATIGRMLGVRLEGMAPPLPSDLWADLTAGVRRVVLVLLDAVGYHAFRRLADEEPAYRRLVEAGRLFPLTSVFPSTTVVALTSLWTGRTPLGHGFLGTRLLLSDQGVMTDMLALSPAAHKEEREVLLDWGWEPERFVTAPSLAALLARQGVQTTALIYYLYLEGGLSRIFLRDVTVRHGYVSLGDLWINLRRAVMEARDGPALIYAYWGVGDTLAHVYGPETEPWQAEMRLLGRALEEDFLAPLPARAREGTLLLVVADHGAVPTPPKQAVRLADHPALQEMLLLPPAGEPRAAYLYVRPDQADALRAYVAEHLADRFVLIETERAVEAGLFGPEAPSPVLRNRLGDFLLLARGDTHLVMRAQEGTRRKPVLRGHHGNLTPEEMLVPLLMVRLDGA